MQKESRVDEKEGIYAGEYFSRIPVRTGKKGGIFVPQEDNVTSSLSQVTEANMDKSAILKQVLNREYATGRSHD